MARASGCSESASTAPASASSRSCRRRAGDGGHSVDGGRPLVSVPVLSNSTVSTVRIRSSASRSLTRMPARAASAVEMAMTSGMASPRACGQAMTSTVTVRSTASLGLAERQPDDERDQRRRSRRSRTAARPRGRPAPGPGTGRPAPARRAGGCRPAPCPRRRRRPAPAAPSRSPRCRPRPGRPAVLGTGRDSPVIIDSSTSARALVDDRHRPAPGRRSAPARRRRSAELVERDRLDRPVGSTRSASSGSSAASASRALEAWPMARISSQWPSSMITTSSAELPPEVQVDAADAERGGGAGARTPR